MALVGKDRETHALERGHGGNERKDNYVPSLIESND